jgi:MFS family permease
VALRLPATFAALRHPSYRLFFAGQLVSLIGTWMQSVAQGWLVFQLTGSALYLGVVAAAGQAPVLALSLVGGVVADRIPKRRLLIATQSTMAVVALALGTLVALGVVRPWHVAVFAALSGIANAFDMPARQAFVVEMVGQGELMNAIALNSSVFHAARIIGPSVAGLLVASVGMAACYFINGLSFVAVIAALALMRLTAAPRARDAGGVWARLVEGVRYVARDRLVGGVMILIACFSLFGLPYTVLMPVFARDILHAGPQGLGGLYAAAGVGALGGSLVLATFSKTRRRALVLIGGVLLFAAALSGFALSRRLPLSLALLAVSGGAGVTFMSSCNTTVQASVPDALRGRVMGIYSLMFMGLVPFGALQAGAVAERFGAPLALGAGALVCAAATVTVIALVPALRRPQDETAAAPPSVAHPGSPVGADPAAGLGGLVAPAANPAPSSRGRQG